MRIIRKMKSWLRPPSARLVEYRRNQRYWQNNSIYMDNIYNKIAIDIAMMKFLHIRKQEDAEWTIYSGSDLADCLTIEPNENDTPVYFWADVVRVVLEKGAAIVVPTYQNGTLRSLDLADEVKVKDNGKYAIVIDDLEIEVDKYNVWIFKNPKKNLTAQLNQITALIDDNLQALSRKINEQENSLIKGFLKLPFKAMDDLMQKRAENVLQQARNVATTGGIGYLDQDVEFQELKAGISTIASEELEFLKMQLYQAFGINEKLFTCDYSESQYRGYFSSVIKVYQRVIAEEINRKHFTKTARTQGQELKIFHDILNIASLKDFTEFTSKGIFNAVINANEARDVIGYAPYALGDVFRTNLNSQIVGEEEGGEKDEDKDDDNQDD